MKKLIILISIILVFGGTYYSLVIKNTGIQIDMEFPKEDIYPGDIFEAQVEVQNNTNTGLTNARILVSLPEGIRLLENPDRVTEERYLDNLGVSSLAKETLKLVMLPGGEKDDYQIEATLRYGTGSLSADFDKSKSFKIKPEKHNFKLEFEIPENIPLGEQFDMGVSYKNVKTEREHLGRYISIVGDDFELTQADPAFEDNRWPLGEEGKISAKGIVSKFSGDIHKFESRVVVDFGDDEYTLDSLGKESLIAPSSLLFEVSADDHRGFILPGDRLNLRVSYENNTDIELEDVTLTLQLIGEMYDFDSIDTNGDFNTFTKTITWVPNDFEKLENISSGSSGSFDILLSLKDSFPIDQINDRNFTLKANGQLRSSSLRNGNFTGDIVSSSLEIPVAGVANVDAKGYFRDAASGIVNNGPFPPRVGQSTNYTIHWVIKNSATDIESVEVQARLQDGVVFSGKAKSNLGSVPEFDPNTGEVTWHIDAVSATTGILSEAPEAIFQIEATPGVGLVGKYMPLLGVTSISAKDIFTNLDISNTDNPVSTKLEDDSTVGPEQGKVISNG